MKKYWVSWVSGYYSDEGCSKPPYPVWITGQLERPAGLRSDCTICAVIQAENEEEVWNSVAKHFPDYQTRFIIEKDSNWIPGNRFQ